MGCSYLISLVLYMFTDAGSRKPIVCLYNTVIHDQWPMITFRVTEDRRPLVFTKFYCSVTEAHVCEQLVHSHHTKGEWLGVKPSPFDRKPNALTLPHVHHLASLFFCIITYKICVSFYRNSYHLTCALWISTTFRVHRRCIVRVTGHIRQLVCEQSKGVWLFVSDLRFSTELSSSHVHCRHNLFLTFLHRSVV